MKSALLPRRGISLVPALAILLTTLLPPSAVTAAVSVDVLNLPQGVTTASAEVLSPNGQWVAGRTNRRVDPDNTVNILDGDLLIWQAGGGLPEVIALPETLGGEDPVEVFPRYISNDGALIVGQYNVIAVVPGDLLTRLGRPFVWTRDGGFQADWPPPAPTNSIFVSGFAETAGVVYGAAIEVEGVSQNGGPPSEVFVNRLPYRLEPAGAGLLPALPLLPEGDDGLIFDSSADGEVLVGLATDAQGTELAVRWDSQGIEALLAPEGGQVAAAELVADDSSRTLLYRREPDSFDSPLGLVDNEGQPVTYRFDRFEPFVAAGEASPQAIPEGVTERVSLEFSGISADGQYAVGVRLLPITAETELGAPLLRQAVLFGSGWPTPLSIKALATIEGDIELPNTRLIRAPAISDDGSTILAVGINANPLTTLPETLFRISGVDELAAVFEQRMADANDNGAPDLLDYALGLPAEVASALPGAVNFITVELEGQTYPALEILRQERAEGIAYQVQRLEGTDAFAFTGEGLLVHEDSDQRLVVRSNTPLDESTRLLLRLETLIE